MKPRVAFVLSTNYAGSHLLAQLLGAHSACVAIGELRDFAKYTGRGSRSGNVVGDYATNPVFEGLAGAPESEWHARIHANLAGAGRPCLFLIDNSKQTDWARRHADEGAVLIHLLRDPRALVARWLASYDRAGRAAQRRRLLRAEPWRLLTRLSDVDVLVAKWLARNRRITRHLRRAGLPSRVVTYEALATDPEVALTPVLAAMGLAFEPQQLRYGEQDALGTRKVDYAEASRASAIVFDRRWQRQLPAETRARIEGDARVRSYLARLGLGMSPDGLAPR